MPLVGGRVDMTAIWYDVKRDMKISSPGAKLKTVLQYSAIYVLAEH